MRIDVTGYEPHTLLNIFEVFRILFPRASMIFTAAKLFHQVMREERSIKLRIGNGGFHETLKFIYVSSCEMLHFVMSYMKQNKTT